MLLQKSKFFDVCPQVGETIAIDNQPALPKEVKTNLIKNMA